MTKEQFNRIFNSLNYRMRNALNARCTRTAKARARDMARLAEEYDGTPYKETYEKLIEEYAL